MSADYSLQATDVTLAETLDRVLDTGAVVRGDIVISVADVDLLYLDVRVLLSAVDTALRHGAIDGHSLPGPQQSGPQQSGPQQSGPQQSGPRPSSTDPTRDD